MSLRAILVVLAVLVLAFRLLLARQKRRRLALAAAPRGHRCPACGARRIVAQKTLALPPAGATTSFELQPIACRACSFRGVAVRAGDAPPRGYAVGWQEHAAFALAVDRCPNPADPSCGCATHRRFGRREGGEPAGLAALEHDPLGFELE